MRVDGMEHNITRVEVIYSNKVISSITNIEYIFNFIYAVEFHL